MREPDCCIDSSPPWASGLSVRDDLAVRGTKFTQGASPTIPSCRHDVLDSGKDRKGKTLASSP